MLNNKSQLGSTFALILAIIAITLLFVLFIWAINNITKFKGIFGARSIAVKMADSSSSLYSLNSYLNAQIESEINGKKDNTTISDLIRLWNIYNDDDYRNALQSATEKIFGPFIKKEVVNVHCYYLEINHYLAKTEGFQYARGNAPDTLTSIQLGDRNLANLNEKATVEIPVSENKTTEVILIINSLCLK